jgi:hypothetical protein
MRLKMIACYHALAPRFQRTDSSVISPKIYGEASGRNTAFGRSMPLPNRHGNRSKAPEDRLTRGSKA